MARHTSAAANSYLWRNGVPVSALPMTLACWIKAATPAQFGANLCYSAASNGWYNIGSLISDPGKVAAYEYDGAAVGVAKTITFPLGTWAHVAGVFTTDSLRAIYLNGASKVTDATACGNLAAFVDRLMVGVSMVGGAVYGTSFDGDFAEVSIHTAALSDAEVALLASGKSAALVRPGNLVAYYKLLGTNSPEPDEKGGTGLTLVNGPTPAPHPPIDYGGTGRMFAVFD